MTKRLVEEMKNKEKFAKEIAEIACNAHSVAVNKITGKPEKCVSLGCIKCLFSRDNGSCNSIKKRREWAESEYVEKPVISKTDRAFLDYLDKNYEYITRDNNTWLYAYSEKPSKGYVFWEIDSGKSVCFDGLIDVDFPMVKWSDEEPWLIDDLKKLEVVEEYEYLEQKARIIPETFEVGEGKDWEAIGNIFDNPELIGETKDGESR